MFLKMLPNTGEITGMIKHLIGRKVNFLGIVKGVVPISSVYSDSSGVVKLLGKSVKQDFLIKIFTPLTNYPPPLILI